MAVDEAILEHVQARSDRSIPTLRLYAWDPACLSLGHAQPFADVDGSRLKERGWKIVAMVKGGCPVADVPEMLHPRRRQPV